DVDDDGLPDLRLGRLPISTITDLQAYTAKLWTYLYTPQPDYSAAVLTYAQNNGYVMGEQVDADAQAIQGAFPSGTDLTIHTDTEATVWQYAYREGLANTAASQYPDHIFWFATGAQRDIYANFWRLDQGWSMNELGDAPSSRRFFVSLGFSCGM